MMDLPTIGEKESLNLQSCESLKAKMDLVKTLSRVLNQNRSLPPKCATSLATVEFGDPSRGRWPMYVLSAAGRSEPHCPPNSSAGRRDVGARYAVANRFGRCSKARGGPTSHLFPSWEIGVEMTINWPSWGKRGVPIWSWSAPENIRSSSAYS